MKRLSLVLGVVLALGRIGLGLDVPHPVFFLSEPLVLWTVPGEGDPTVSHGDAPVTSEAWDRAPAGERIRWEASLPPAGPGVWVACTDRACHAFLRVPDEVGVVEVQASPGALLTLAGQAKVADALGWAFFVVAPGEHELVAELEGEASRQSVEVRPGERIARTLVLAAAGVSSPVALPGHTVTLSVRLIAPRDHLALNADLALPAGWEASPTPGVYDPLRAGELAVRSWRITIPAEAAAGAYVVGMAFPDLGLEAQASLAVAHRLPPREVVGHWDIAADWLDLSLPSVITYERLLWAATFVGRELPFTGRTLTQADLEALAREWEGSP